MSQAGIKANKCAVIKQRGIGDIDFTKALEDVVYLRNLLGEVERRRLFAVMCMTPDKILKESALGLSRIVKDMSALGQELKGKVKALESRVGDLADKTSNLTDGDKKRIDKFLKR